MIKGFKHKGLERFFLHVRGVKNGVGSEATCRITSTNESTAPIPVLTAYIAPVARRLEEAGIPVLLVGDTVEMVEIGFGSTREVTLEHMEYHIALYAAVRRTRISSGIFPTR